MAGSHLEKGIGCLLLLSIPNVEALGDKLDYGKQIPDIIRELFDSFVAGACIAGIFILSKTQYLYRIRIACFFNFIEFVVHHDLGW